MPNIDNAVTPAQLAALRAVFYGALKARGEHVWPYSDVVGGGSAFNLEYRSCAPQSALQGRTRAVVIWAAYMEVMSTSAMTAMGTELIALNAKNRRKSLDSKRTDSRPLWSL